MTTDVVIAAPRLLIPHKPAVVVYYCGDNDLAANRTELDAPIAGFQKFVGLVHEALPRTRIIYLSIKPSPARTGAWPAAQRANAMIQEWCAKDPLLTYVDVATPMLGADGSARAELFGKDKLHMNETGYAIWHDAVRPVLDKVWGEAQREGK